MNEQKYAHIFSTLACETRLRLLEILDTKELSCRDFERCGLDERCCDLEELAKELGISPPAVSYHLKELRRAGFIRSVKKGRHVYSSLDRRSFESAAGFFKRYGGRKGVRSCGSKKRCV